MVMAALLCAAPLSGCIVANELRTRLFDTNKVNLTDTTYAAADMLAPQAKSRITQNTPIRTAVITDVAHPDETTPFGTQIANQLSSRLVQLGYNVQSVPLPPAMVAGLPGAPARLTTDDDDAAPRSIKAMGTRTGDCLVGGTYTIMQNTIQISLRITQAPDQRIIAAYDYSVPLTPEMRELSLSAADRAKKETQALPLSDMFN